MEDKESIEVDKEKLWEQLKAQGKEPFVVTFEALETEENGKTACFVKSDRPEITSNYQHASLFNGMFGFMKEYIDDIETFEELEAKMLPINEIREGLLDVSMFVFEKMLKLAPKDKLKDKLEKLKNLGKEETDDE